MHLPTVGAIDKAELTVKEKIPLTVGFVKPLMLLIYPMLFSNNPFAQLRVKNGLSPQPSIRALFRVLLPGHMVVSERGCYQTFGLPMFAQHGPWHLSHSPDWMTFHCCHLSFAVSVPKFLVLIA